MSTVTLRLPATAVHVRTARLIAAAMARRSGVDEEVLDEVRLAVGEACARAVRQHERHGVTAPVTVEFADADGLEIAVLDQAPAGVPPGSDPATGELPAGRNMAAAAGPGGSAPPAGSGSAVPGSAVPGSAGSGSAVPGSAVPGSDPVLDGQAGRAPVVTSAPPADPTPDALGLALLGALVTHLSVAAAAEAGGTRITMWWPGGH